MIYNIPMRPDTLAIETSSAQGSLTVGRGDTILQTVELTQARRHNLQLLAAIARVCEPAELRQVYLNVGPGSFTGLRVAVTAAKMLAMTLNVRLVGVEAVDVLAAQAGDHEHLAVCVHHKREAAYARLYHRGRPAGDARLISFADLFAAAPRPLALVADVPDLATPDGVRRLDPITPCSRTVYRLGRAGAEKQVFADPATITPRYARPPEAVTLWEQNKRNE